MLRIVAHVMCQKNQDSAFSCFSLACQDYVSLFWCVTTEVGECGRNLMTQGYIL